MTSNGIKKGTSAVEERLKKRAKYSAGNESEALEEEAERYITVVKGTENKNTLREI